MTNIYDGASEKKSSDSRYANLFTDYGSVAKLQQTILWWTNILAIAAEKVLFSWVNIALPVYKNI